MARIRILSVGPFMTTSIKSTFRKTTIAIRTTCAIAGITTAFAAFANPHTQQAVGAATLHVGDFALLDQNGVFHQLTRDADKKAVAIMAYDGSCASDKQA